MKVYSYYTLHHISFTSKGIAEKELLISKKHFPNIGGENFIEKKKKNSKKIKYKHSVESPLDAAINLDPTGVKMANRVAY